MYNSNLITVLQQAYNCWRNALSLVHTYDHR